MRRKVNRLGDIGRMARQAVGDGLKAAAGLAKEGNGNNRNSFASSEKDNNH